MPNAAVFWHLNLALIGIVGAIVRGATEPLLVTHEVNIWSFLLAKVVYCIAVLVADDIINPAGAQQQINQENYTNIWDVLAFVSGSLASVSLISTFFLRSTGYIILCIAWISSAIIIVVYQYGRLLMGGCGWLYDEILKPFFINLWNRIKGNDMLTETELRAQPAV